MLSSDSRVKVIARMGSCLAYPNRLKASRHHHSLEFQTIPLPSQKLCLHANAILQPYISKFNNMHGCSRARTIAYAIYGDLVYVCHTLRAAMSTYDSHRANIRCTPLKPDYVMLPQAAAYFSTFAVTTVGMPMPLRKNPRPREFR